MQSAIGTDPKNATARYVLANCLVAVGQPAMALPEVRQAIVLDAKEVGCYLALSRVAIALKENDTLIEAYKNLVQLEPDNQEYKKELDKALTDSKDRPK